MSEGMTIVGTDPLRDLRAKIRVANVIDATDDQANAAIRAAGSRAGQYSHKYMPNKVYFLQHRDMRLYKIGATSTLFTRKRMIESEYARERGILKGRTRLAAAAWGSLDHERHVHAMFAHLRVRHPQLVSTEWFRGDPELVKYIAGLIADDIAWIPEDA